MRNRSLLWRWLLALLVGLMMPAPSGAKSMEVPKDPAERAKLKCELRRQGVDKLVKMLVNEGDARSAEDALRLLDVQNRVTLTRKMSKADMEVVRSVLAGKACDIVQARALGTLWRPLTEKMLPEADRERFHPLVKAHLTHPSGIVRLTAIQVIAAYADPDDYPAIVKLKRDDDPLVARMAQQAVAAYEKAGRVPKLRVR